MSERLIGDITVDEFVEIFRDEFSKAFGSVMDSVMSDLRPRFDSMNASLQSCIDTCDRINSRIDLSIARLEESNDCFKLLHLQEHSLCK